MRRGVYKWVIERDKKDPFSHAIIDSTRQVLYRESSIGG